MILDNCEHLVEDCAAFLQAFLRRPGSSTVLATTREFFDIDGERTIRLSQLDTTAIDGPAVTLLVQVATAPLR